MQWVIKTIKLCNLRCKYCYEWEYLSDTSRMSEATWKHVLVAIRDYTELTAERSGVEIPISIIWHGGEPTLLPSEYFHRVIELQREIFPPDWTESNRVSNCLQTNLYSISDERLGVLDECGFELGISIDFCEGVRVSADGKTTEDRVLENIQRLQARGVPFCIITVLAGHTVAQIEKVYEGITAVNQPARLLPLFSGPATRPMEGVDVDRHGIIGSMMTLFDLWFSQGMVPRIDPFDQCVRTVVLKKLNLVRPRQDRELLGNDVFVVDRDGTLSCDAYREPKSIGNITDTAIGDILNSPVYRQLMTEETQLKAAVCTRCAFVGPCDTSPIARNFDSHVIQDCPTEKYLLPMIEAYLDKQGFFEHGFRTTARAVTASFLEERFGATLARPSMQPDKSPWNGP